MCLAIPAEIIELEDDIAKVRVGDTETTLRISVMLLPERPVIGDFVIVHAGFAMHLLDRDEARETIRILREMATLMDDHSDFGQ